METSKTKAVPAESIEPTPTLFVHAPRAPYRSNDRFGYQCRFSDGGHWALDRIRDGHSARVIVYRNSEENVGSLSIAVRVLECGGSDVELQMTADEMQTLACALLDAAHHLRTVPATTYVASATADAEAVPA